MKTSKAGTDLIRRNEGCELTAYLDKLANPPIWTIGFGDTQNVHPGMTITKHDAEERLATRLANEFEPGVMEAIGYAPVTQSQFDAMVSLAWNVGVGAFAGSSVARHHRAGNYSAAADAFLKWNKAKGRVLKGLTRRREEERALYLSDAAQVVDDTEITAIDRDLLADLIRAVQRVVGAVPDGYFGTETATKIKAAQKEKRA